MAQVIMKFIILEIEINAQAKILLFWKGDDH
jgi:hypothetical protein